MEKRHLVIIVRKKQVLMPSGGYCSCYDTVFAGCFAEPADVHGVLLLSLLHGGQSLYWAAQVHKHSTWAATLAISKTAHLHIMVCSICRVHEINSLLAPFDYTTQPSWQNPKFLGEWRCRKRMMKD